MSNTEKTVRITDNNCKVFTKWYRGTNKEILEKCGRVFNARKVVISGREYCRTGAGYTYTGRV